jgi:CBS domain-containing protein
MLGFWRRGQGLFLENHADTATPVGEVVRGAVHALSEREPVYSAFKLVLAGHRNIPVTDSRGEKFKGIVNSRTLLDFLGGGGLHEVFLSRKRALDVPVSRIMETGHREVKRGDNLEGALSVFKETGEEALPLVNRGRFDGMVKESDIVHHISGPTGVGVWEVMTSKPLVVRVSHPVADVASMLVKGGYRRLPVIRDFFLTGIVTPFDIINYLNRNKKLSGLRQDRNGIGAAMNKHVVTIGSHADIAEAVERMRSRQVCMLPVVDEYVLLGVLTQRDILEAM